MAGSPKPEDRYERLSEGERIELVARVGELARARVPLDRGLRAIAEELPRGRMRSLARQMARDLEQGGAPEAVLAAARQQPLGALLSASLRGDSTESVEAIDAFVTARRAASDLLVRAWLALIYPALLLGFIAAIGLFVFADIVPRFSRILEDWRIQLPFLTEAAIAFSRSVEASAVPLLVGVAAAIVAVVVAAALPSGRRRLVWLPVFGPLYLWNDWAQFFRMLALLLRAGTPLPAAMKQAAASTELYAVQAIAGRMTEAVNQGRSLAEAFEAQGTALARLAPLLQWGTQRQQLPACAELIASIYEHRLHGRADLIRAFVGPVVFALIIPVVCLLVVSLYLPLFMLLGSIGAGGAGPAGPSTGEIQALVVIFVGYIGVLLLFVAPVAVWRAMSVQNMRRQQLVLRGLALAASGEMPLPAAAQAMATAYRGHTSAELLALAELLRSGVALQDALDRLPALVPEGTRPAIRLGCEAGAPGPALTAAASQLLVRQELWSRLATRLLYIALLGIIAFSNIGFLIAFVAPRIRLILSDFGVAPSPLTEFVFSLADPTGLHGLLAILMLASLLVISLNLPIMVLCRLLGIGTPLERIEAKLGQVERSNLMRALSIHVGLERPMMEGLSTLARSHSRSSVRHHLYVALSALREGVAWEQALRDAGLISKGDAAVLTAAQRVGNLAWALDELASAHERRAAYRIRVAIDTLTPIVMLAIGTLIGLFIMGFFLPMIALIRGLV